MGAILCFHSVTTPGLPAEGTAHVPLEAFRSYIRVASRLGRFVPLGELVQRHAQGRSTSGLIALTLDDAYASLCSEFRDLVSREALPIAIFVVTRAAAKGATYWWDRIEDLFPRVESARWRALEAACGVPEEYRRGQPRDHGPLRPLRQWLLASYAGRWPDHLEPALAALEREVGHQTRHRSMTFQELADLAAMPGVELGVHTVSHPVLPLLPDEDLAQEVAAGFATLRERFRSVLPILAIPFGLYDERTVRFARSAGMTTCLSLGGGLVDGQLDHQVLPRICINRGETSARLGLRLLGVPDLVRRCLGRPPESYPDLPSATT
jgi:peptidoglycan/xylan/chitin deacetylase (PgdA/CDA1 family)